MGQIEPGRRVQTTTLIMIMTTNMNTNSTTSAGLLLRQGIDRPAKSPTARTTTITSTSTVLPLTPSVSSPCGATGRRCRIGQGRG